MKIAHVIQRYAPAIGGSESWCRLLAREQVRLGHQVRVLTLDIVREQEFWIDPETDGERAYRPGHLDVDQGVEVRRFRRSLPLWSVHHLVLAGLLGRALNIFQLGPHSLEQLAALRAELDWADVVHLHALPYPHVGLGLRVARRAGKPAVVTPHFHPGHRDYERPHQYRRLRVADAVVVASEHEAAYLAGRGVPAQRITVAGCAVPSETPAPDGEERAQAAAELRRRLGLRRSTRLIACVARQTPEKGLEALTRAVQRLIAEGRDVGLVLMGPRYSWFAGFLAALPPSVLSRVFDLGSPDEPEKARVLAGCDVFAMPSRHEAFGLVFLEAWCAGLPVVGGDSGAQPEVIGDGGLAVPFGDAAAIGAALAALLDDPAGSGRMVAAGRQRLRGMTPGRLAATVHEVYRSVLHARGVPDPGETAQPPPAAPPAFPLAEPRK